MNKTFTLRSVIGYALLINIIYWALAVYGGHYALSQAISAGISAGTVLMIFFLTIDPFRLNRHVVCAKDMEMKNHTE